MASATCGCDTGPSEDHVFWTRFLRDLVKRGLKGAELVISDSHEGLKGAMAKVFPEASWQRCRVDFMRNLLSTATRGAQEAVATGENDLRSARPRLCHGSLE